MSDLRVCQPEDVYGRGFWARLEPGDLYRPRRKNVIPLPKIGRNEPCPCGSGRKSKKCCIAEAA